MKTVFAGPRSSSVPRLYVEVEAEYCQSRDQVPLKRVNTQIWSLVTGIPAAVGQSRKSNTWKLARQAGSDVKPRSLGLTDSM